MLTKILLAALTLAEASPLIQVSGVKFAENPQIEGVGSVTTKAIRPSTDSFAGGMNKLLPYVISSPYQDDAGSCLFMSHTGIAEWWLSRLGGGQRVDLSERYFMNLSKAGIGDAVVDDWRTDTIYRLNATGVMYRNSDFPFLKAWYSYQNGERVFSTPNAPGAYYGPAANWVVSLNNLTGAPIPMPHFERTVLHADPTGNQWEINSTPEDIVERMKTWLREKEAPLLVIYNHHAFWHAVMVVGYNDHTSSEGCEFTTTFTDTMNEKARESRLEAAQTSDPDERRRLLSKAQRDEARGAAVASELARHGGCRNRGVFYVRDSLYPDRTLPLYDFDPATSGEEEHLVAPIILREYEWVERLANHVIGITAQ